MIDIEVQSQSQLGVISRPFSPQLKARTLSDPLREFYQSKVARIQAIDYPVVGVDISSWQGSIDWSRLAAKVYFVFIRAGRGNADRDAMYSVYLTNAHAKKRAVGVYWYMKPNTTGNWKNHLASIIPVYKSSGSQLPMVFDFEETALNKSNTMAWMTKIINGFKEETDQYPMIYTSSGFWNTNLERSDLPKQCLLWVAHWTTADTPIIPNDWGQINNPKTWTFWQHSSKGSGIDYGVSSLNIDLDRYHYSLSAFNSQFKTNLLPLDGTVPPPPPPPPPVEPTHDEKVERLWAYAKKQGWEV